MIPAVMERRGLSRRSLLGMMAALPLQGAGGMLIDTHVHLFADDEKRFPFSSTAPYKPKPQPVEAYSAFVKQAGIAHTVIVHPEPYQDDHRYLEYCFAHEPSPGYFKGTCLFDPIAPETPARMEALVKNNPGRIVAIRIHEVRKPGEPALITGAIKDRDMRSPAMKQTWAKAQALGLAIQMHFIPYYASQIGELARQFPALPVVLDHLARAGQGTSAEYEDVLKLAKLPKVFMKYSGVNYSSKEKYPFRDAQPIVRKAYDAFGPDRMVWGGLGMSMPEFRQQSDLFESMFAYAPEADKAKIRGLTAKKLYRF